MPAAPCPACGKPVADAAAACAHCGRPAGGRRRRGLPVWGKILLVLLLVGVVLGCLAATKPSEAELRQAIRDKAKELQAKGVGSPLALIDDPQHAGRFTYHEGFLSSEIRFTRADGEPVRVAVGYLGSVTVSDIRQAVR